MSKKSRVDYLTGFTPLEIRSLRERRMPRGALSLVGFTMVEIVVMLGIIVLISAVLLANFPGFNESGALIRARQELALDFRRLQNYALAVSNVRLEGGSLELSPKIFGAHFNMDAPDSYILFVDRTGGTPNGYDEGFEGVISRGELQRSINLNCLYVSGSCVTSEYNVPDVVFRAPEARMTISADGISPIGSTFVKVEMKTPNLNLKKTVSVWITGYIGTV